LEYEETLNYELGYSLSNDNFSITTSLFRKEGKNLIDWTRKIGTEIWHAQNISKINITGYEIGLKINLKKLLKQNVVSDLQLNYTRLKADKTVGSSEESKYLLDFLKHQFIGKISNSLPFNLLQNWTFRYEERINFEDSFIVDTQITKQYKYFKVFIRATNLLDRNYRDIAGVDLPGRWITGGITLNIGEQIF